MTDFDYDWADFAFGSKKPLNELKATFIAAPRDISLARFTQLLKEYLPKGNIILGVSKEPYVFGFEGQPQFRMVRQSDLQTVIDKVNASSRHKVCALRYLQRELNPILEKVKMSRAVFINGSWQYSFHTSATYYMLVNKDVPFELVSAFANEDEARTYEQRVDREIAKPALEGVFSDIELMRLGDEVAKQSYDHTFQTGTILAQKVKTGYAPLLSAFNKVLPFQTYALLNGASREKNFSPPNDLNHYDAIHAEMSLIIQAQKQNVSLKGTSLFVNLMPCPNCSRMIAETDIEEIVYRIDHSEGYAVDLLTKVEKDIRRIVY